MLVSKWNSVITGLYETPALGCMSDDRAGWCSRHALTHVKLSVSEFEPRAVDYGFPSSSQVSIRAAVDSADGIPNVPRLPEFCTNRIPNIPVSKLVKFDALWEVMWRRCMSRFDCSCTFLYCYHRSQPFDEVTSEQERKGFLASRTSCKILEAMRELYKVPARFLNE
jgi:hypothetical protein